MIKAIVDVEMLSECSWFDFNVLICKILNDIIRETQPVKDLDSITNLKLFLILSYFLFTCYSGHL